MMVPEVYVLADIHGNWKCVRDFLDRNPRLKQRDESQPKPVLIILGDAGINFFFNHRDTELKKYLSKLPIDLFCIRGNHEQRPSIIAREHPDDWTFESFWDGLVLVEKDYPNIKYAMDYPSLYIIDNKKTLVYPGAWSPDKEYRILKGWSYFPMEQMTEEERKIGLELAKKNPEVDYILAHTCPRVFEPFIQDLFLIQIDQSKADKTTENYLNNIIELCHYKRFYFGHYHDNRNIEPYKATMIFHDAIPFGKKFGQYW